MPATTFPSPRTETIAGFARFRAGRFDTASASNRTTFPFISSSLIIVTFPVFCDLSAQLSDLKLCASAQL
jgi:hypothetical protein